MSTSPVRVDLGQYQDAGSKVFSGRPRGAAVRERAKLTVLEGSAERIDVHVPEDTISLTSSFFLGMFRDSIRGLQEAGFRARYQFTGKDVSRVVNDSIREALKRESPLDLAMHAS